MSKFIEVIGSYTHQPVYINADSILRIYDKKAYTPQIPLTNGHEGSNAAILQCAGTNKLILFVDETVDEILAKIDQPRRVDASPEYQPEYPESIHSKNEELARETNRLLREYAEKKKAPKRVDYPFHSVITQQ